MNSNFIVTTIQGQKRFITTDTFTEKNDCIYVKSSSYPNEIIKRVFEVEAFELVPYNTNDMSTIADMSMTQDTMFRDTDGRVFNRRCEYIADAKLATI